MSLPPKPAATGLARIRLGVSRCDDEGGCAHPGRAVRASLTAPCGRTTVAHRHTLRRDGMNSPREELGTRANRCLPVLLTQSWL